jgi:hypothetical protein
MAPGVPGSLVGGSVDYWETPCCLLAWLNRRRIPLNGGRGERHRVARGPDGTALEIAALMARTRTPR